MLARAHAFLCRTIPVVSIRVILAWAATAFTTSIAVAQGSPVADVKGDAPKKAGTVVEQTEAAVDRGLDWLIAHQLEDGGWSFDLTACPKCRGQCRDSAGAEVAKDRVAATALSMMAFLSRGYTHKDGPHRTLLEHGNAFLLAKVAESGGKLDGPGGSMRAQGLASWALCESYAMSQDKRLAKPAQMTLDAIMAAQDPETGGWMRGPGEPCDTLTLGWQIEALKSGNMAYLEIDASTVLKATRFLDSVQADGGTTYGLSDSSKPDVTASAVGLTCRMLMGWKRDNPALQDGVSRMAKIGPTDDLIFDFYGTRVMKHMPGDFWGTWHDQLKKKLLESQVSEGHEKGSWYDGVSGGSAFRGGRLGCTALATMILCERRRLWIVIDESGDEFRE